MFAEGQEAGAVSGQNSGRLTWGESRPSSSLGRNKSNGVRISGKTEQWWVRKRDWEQDFRQEPTEKSRRMTNNLAECDCQLGAYMMWLNEESDCRCRPWREGEARIRGWGVGRNQISWNSNLQSQIRGHWRWLSDPSRTIIQILFITIVFFSFCEWQRGGVMNEGQVSRGLTLKPITIVSVNLTDPAGTPHLLSNHPHCWSSIFNLFAVVLIASCLCEAILNLLLPLVSLCAFQPDSLPTLYLLELTVPLSFSFVFNFSCHTYRNRFWSHVIVSNMWAGKSLYMFPFVSILYYRQCKNEVYDN